ncbi:MAG: hypothetical protein U1C51_09640, partial [Candidatus Izemoplasmatales bacterium]|nr:hypothetical protein [Candidatus Izemoplasmatales bacterium]
FWFHLEETHKGYLHYSVALSIAKQLKATPETSTPDLINRLIHYAEKLARIEENTYDLTSSLGKVAEVYAICGFKEDFKRIYNELIDVSFGVHDRKDYRVANILVPLEMVRKIDPDKTLTRLSQIFAVQNNLSDAGNRRMHHICVSDLIAFTAQEYPELAFQLLEKEERNISREEAYDIVFIPMIRVASNEKLRLFLSLIKTLPRWEIGGSRDNHFLELCLCLLRRVLQLHNESFIRELLDIVKYNILVEIDKPVELCRFSEEFVHTDMNYLDYSLPEPTTIEEEMSEKFNPHQYNKFIKKLHPFDIAELSNQFTSNYTEFENFIRSQYEVCLRNNRNQAIREDFYRLEPIFQDYVASLPSELNSISESQIIRTIRNYLSIKNHIVNLDPESIVRSADLEKYLNSFIETTNVFFPENTFVNFVEDKFDKSTWLEHILERINGTHQYIFSMVLSEENVYHLVDNVSILQIENILNFVDKWISGINRSVCYLKLAYRM